MPWTPLQLKRFLGLRLLRYWSKSRPVYAGFLDSAYQPISPQVWNQIIDRAPSRGGDDFIGYIKDVYDCDDHAFEFKVHAAKTQVRHHPDVPHPFAIGVAVGRFDWANNGKTPHAVNFAVIEEESGEKRIEWYDLMAGRSFEFERICDGLIWVLI